MNCPNCDELVEPIIVPHEDGSHDEKCPLCGYAGPYSEWVRASDLHYYADEDEDDFEDED